jgi:hypothetical protein
MTRFHYPEREEIDPEGRYQVAGLTQVERHALTVVRLLPLYRMERTRDLFQFTAADHEAPVLVVTSESLELRLPRAEWPHPNIPAASSRLWKRVDWEGLDDATLTRLVDEARRARHSEFTACRFCGRTRAPEFLTDGACDDCAAEHLGIVH